MNQDTDINTNNDRSDLPQRTKGISQGFEHLVYDLYDTDKAQRKSENDFDVIIVGSGYGGAIAAAELSACQQDGKPLSVCVLERGKEYLPGSFPAGFNEVPSHIRFNTPASPDAKGTDEGLFDFRINGDMSALIGNGLGGGSLINAGVMEIPLSSRFNGRWPRALQNRDDLLEYYHEAKVLLGAASKKDSAHESFLHNLVDNTIEAHQSGTPAKYDALKNLGHQGKFRPAAITVAMQDKTSCSGLKLNACNYCGDCATGCNFGAKESLDTNLLDLAFTQGAKIYTGATVLRLEKELIPDGDDYRWKIITTYTDKSLRKRQGEAVEITAQRVILAAGSFGSTEILKRSESKALHFSHKLGERFSGNGDMIASVYGQQQPVNGVSKREIKPTDRRVGPTITGIVEAGSDALGNPFIIEELAVPNALRQFYSELMTTSNLLIGLSDGDDSVHHDGPVLKDPWAIDPDAMDSTAVIAVFGDDGANGTLELHDNKDNIDGNGSLNVRWPGINGDPLFQQQMEALGNLNQASPVSGTVIPNPFWKFLPDSMEYLAEGNMRGPLITVHPLGGCIMADKPQSGVVDQYGRVYDPDNRGKLIHDGLVVLDGAIIPTALGTNPALTIAAVSLRAARNLIDKIWKLDSPRSPRPTQERARDTYRDAMDDYPGDLSKTPAPYAPTEVQLVERLGGKSVLRGNTYYIEITARYLPKDIIQLASSGKRRLRIDDQILNREDDSRIRIYHYDDWKSLTHGGVYEIDHIDPDDQLESELEKIAVFSAPLSGDLSIFERMSSSSYCRIFKALWSWLLNRGMRDTYQDIAIRMRVSGTSSEPKKSFFERVRVRVRDAWNLASKAGEIRTLNYTLQIGKDIVQDPAFKLIADRLSRKSFKGIKTLTYTRRSNPWRQLMELCLEDFPGGNQPVLQLDTKFSARQGVPLFKITSQHDKAIALADVGSFLSYILRFLISMHLWNFRKPDDCNPDTPKRLPCDLSGPCKYEISELPTGDVIDGKDVMIRLTRYPNYGKPPLITIHGYSVGGTCFTHEAISNNLVDHFTSDYDIWILDLRTSCGMPASTEPWSFEDIAFKDIPVAFKYVYEETGQPLHVLAHCMGAAMLSMAILKEPDRNDMHFESRSRLPEWIECLVLSQVGPVVNYSSDNMLRTYLLNFFQYLMPYIKYRFRLEDDPTLVDLLLDRALSSLPYPKDEFNLANPILPWKKTPYTRTRQRVDALYSQNFNLKNMNQKMLINIDDLYGPLNFQTIAQAIHFARWKSITTKKGYNDYVSREHFEKRWTFNTFSIHGEDNALFDVSTVKLIKKHLDEAGINYSYQTYPDIGHLDCLIGEKTEAVFRDIETFFNNNRDNRLPQDSTMEKPRPKAIPPTIGPFIGTWRQGPDVTQPRILPISVGSSPGMTAPFFTVVVPVKQQGDRYVHVGTKEQINIFPHDAARELKKFAVSENIFNNGALGALVFFIHDHNAQSEDIESLLDEDLVCPISLDSKGQLTNISAVEELLPGFENAISEAIDKPACELESCYITPDLSRTPRSGNEESICFAYSSCQYPAGILDRDLAYHSYQRLNAILSSNEDKDNEKPSVLILVGDQVYVDATAGLFDPSALDDRYLRPYQDLYQNEHVNAVLRQVPSYNMLDDHEIDDNWEPVRPELDCQTNESYMTLGRDAFIRWQQKFRPYKKTNPCILWHAFEENGFPFFMIDSRTEREHRRASDTETPSMLSPEQFEALEDWLGALKDDDRPKFIVSPAMPLPRTTVVANSNSPAAAIRSDSWDGYPTSLKRLMTYIVEKQVQNVIFLSGDAHLSLVSEVILRTAGGDDSKPDINLLSVHSSGMYSPYPFANARKEDLALKESFTLSDQDDNKLKVNVTTDEADICPGDGFAIIQVSKEDGSWIIDITFDRADKTDTRTISKTL